MREIVLKNFGNRVKLLRLEKGISQESLAYDCGFHRTYMGFIERGLRNPTLLNVYRIADALDVSLSKLVDFTCDE